MWSKVGNILQEHAPTLATMLLGPQAGVAVKLISSTLGVGEDPDEVLNAIQDSPAYLEKLAELDLAFVQAQAGVQTTMLTTEATTKHTTRPKIALGAFYVVSLITLIFTLPLGIAIIKGEWQTIKALGEAWPLAATLTIPFVGWLNNYFGILSKEEQNRLHAASGKPLVAPKSILSFLRGN